MKTTLYRLLGLLAFAVAAPADAADVCVDTVPELVQALGAFANQPDGSTLIIRVVQGTYVVNSQLGNLNLVAFPNSVGLKLLGGYTANCAGRVLNPANTIIDGNNQIGSGVQLVIDDDAPATFQGLTFTRMVGNTAAPGALDIGSDSGTSDAAVFSVRHCRFTHNSGNYVVHMRGPEMRFVNNLVVDNALSGGGAAAVQIEYAYDADSGTAVNNNTIANNAGGAGLNVRSNSGYASTRKAEIADNIVWGNGSPDLRFNDFDSANNALFVSYNLYGTITGASAPAGNSSGNPQFINSAAGNYGLAAISPAINSGAAYQLYSFPDFDLAGSNRVIGSRIDRGAFESSQDDLTGFVVTNTGDNGNNASPTAGSLRAAIRAANLAGVPFKISFAISGACPHIINMTTAMLDVTGDVTIDARTQSGWSANTDYGRFDANLCVVANGSGATPYAFHVPSSASAARLVVHGMMFAGFTDAAIKLEGGANHRISGNQFGAVPFTAANHDAIRVTGNSGGTFIGGFDDPSAVNLIAGSTNAGIYLDNASGGSTIGNAVIGYQADGVGVGGNNVGVYIFNSPNNSLLYNYIGYSSNNGVTISGASANGTLAQYNRIGIDWQGNAAGNASAGIGILFAANGSTVGAPQGSSFGGNLIEYNTGPGVWISTSGGAGNRVLGNQYLENGGVDIDLASAGPSANQASNPGIGPNHLQNYPVLSSAVRTAGAAPAVVVAGTLHSAANSAYRIDVYYASACDASAPGRGSAYIYLGRGSVQSNAGGDSSFSLTLPAPGALFGPGAISAVATNAAGDTSEVGNCVMEVSGNLPNPVFANGFE